jgi:hypothetical protein
MNASPQTVDFPLTYAGKRENRNEFQNFSLRMRMLEATTEATMLGWTWEDNINVNLKELGREKNGWIYSE